MARLTRAGRVRVRPKTRAQQMMERMKRLPIEEPGYKENRIKRYWTDWGKKTPTSILNVLKSIKKGNVSQARQIAEDAIYDMDVAGGKEWEILADMAQEIRAVRTKANIRAQQHAEFGDRPPLPSPFEKYKTVPKVKPLVRAEKQKKKRPRSLAKEPLDELREERIPQKRATRASIQFDQHRGIRGLIGSSFINYLDYEPETKVVNVRLGYRNYHTTKDVPQSVFLRWKRGEATCQTNDKSSLKRWTIGKTPSLGAFFNVYIKGRYGLQRGLA